MLIQIRKGLVEKQTWVSMDYCCSICNIFKYALDFCMVFIFRGTKRT